ncbi:MAG TPA: uroporphyrinogen-III synthase [Pyrinomonadaceae bacterium]|nr:uroporphyrinogen-III synthase [Pyrinomonadaceae bacterium]
MRNRVVLVARRNDEFSSTLRGHGCDVINLELIKTEPVENLSDLDERLVQLDIYDGVFMTSQNAARIFAERLGEKGFHGKVYVLGERSRAVLENTGLNVVFREDVNTVEELINSLGAPEFSGRKLLFVRGNRSMRTVAEMLGGIADIEEVEVYRTVDADIDETRLVNVRERLARREIDWICFFSPSAVERFIELFGSSDTKITAIGKTTGDAVQRAGLNLQLVSPRAASKDFALTLIKDGCISQK